MTRKTHRTNKHDPRFWLRYGVAPQGTDRAIAEITSLRDQGRIHGVLVFVGGVEERGPGLITLDEQRRWLDEVRPLFEFFRKQRIPWGLNVWQTIGFTRTQPGLRRPVPYQHMIGHDGTPAEEWGCPLDPRFLEHLVEMYGMLAAEKPDSLWIDDDFRYFGRNPAPLVCFCPLHLEEMRRRTGRQFTRESLVKAIGDPYAEEGKIRSAWLNMQYESLADIASGIQKRVSLESPRTHLSLMTGAIEHRFFDGWDWPDLIKRLWPKGRVRIRPGFGFYAGGDPRPYLFGTTHPRQQQALVPKNAELWPEIENYPGGIFSRSARSIQMQLMVASFFGMGRDVTLSITGMMVPPIREIDPIFEAIEAIEPVMSALNAAVAAHPQEDGLRLLMSGRIAYHQDWTGDLIWQWPHHRPWDYVLPNLGFPVSFAPRGKAVSVATGAGLARALGAKRITELLREGLYCDGSFASAMSQMEGLPIQPRVTGMTVAAMEEVTDDSFGRAGDAISLRQTPKLFTIETGGTPATGLPVSWFLDHYGKRVTPGTVVYDGGAAGRLAVVALEGQLLTDLWTYFRALGRKRQLEAVLTWLGNVPAIACDHPDVYPIVRRNGSSWLIGMTNLRDDPWKRVSFDLSAAKPPRRAAILNAKGVWKPVKMKAEQTSRGRVKVTLPGVPVTWPMAVWRLE
ncbi:MAG: hypothetical protein IT444_10715 [Phycisphaeraceae bacterium]|nr:hypothetical protein [Phycisphaeraceae bacterium]